MEFEGLLVCSQESATCFCPKPGDVNSSIIDGLQTWFTVLVYSIRCENVSSVLQYTSYLMTSGKGGDSGDEP